MATTVTVKCPSCDASYQAPVTRAGAHFKCKKCNQILTVPSTDAEVHMEPAPERPVVAPSTPARPVVAPSTPPPQASRPVVAPSTPPAQAPRPVVAPSTPPAQAARPVVAPRAASAALPPTAAAATPARPRSSRSGRGLPPVPEPASEPVKSRTPLVLVILGLLAVICIGGYLAWPKSSGNPETPTTTTGPGPVAEDPKKPKPPTFDAAQRLKELKAETGSDSAVQLMALSQKLEAELASWREKSAPADAISQLEQDREAALDKIIELAPDHAEARAMRGEVKYGQELDPFFDATYLSDSERELVRKNRLLVNLKAGENKGWIPKSTFETQVKPLVEKFSVAQVEAEKVAASPFGKAAKELEGKVLADLTKYLGGKTAFRAFIHEPYLLFVEENPGWSPQEMAKSLFSPLKAIHEAFLREFGGLGLEPLKEPVPVVYFKSEEQYHEYNKALGHDDRNVLAHYEPGTGRLALNRGVDHEVIIHEGTHQVFDRYTKDKLPHPRQSFWFQEGIAEWFGGSNRVQAKDGSWSYETGVLHGGRLDFWNTVANDKWFTVDELLDQTYSKRNEYMLRGGEGQVKIGLVYSQGWFLIYFLNHFNVDANGMVKIAEKGKYLDGWKEYLKAELTGKTGKQVFKECLKIDDAGLAKMNEEYRSYFEFVRRKRNLGQVQDKKLVPWDLWVNKKGVKAGEKEDDLLVDPRKK